MQQVCEWVSCEGLPHACPAAGPERRKLKIKDPARYSWQPKEVLAQIAAIYVHLGRADAGGAFARAIVDDERSYRRDMFPEAAQARALLKVAHGHTSCAIDTVACQRWPRAWYADGRQSR